MAAAAQDLASLFVPPNGKGHEMTMNERGVPVVIVWNSVENGGKAMLPCRCDYYVNTAVIARGHYQGSSWSLVLYIENNAGEGDCRIGRGFARCLVSEAPPFLLTSGHFMTIYEGGRCVGELYVQ